MAQPSNSSNVDSFTLTHVSKCRSPISSDGEMDSISNAGTLPSEVPSLPPQSNHYPFIEDRPKQQSGRMLGGYNRIKSYGNNASRNRQSQYKSSQDFRKNAVSHSFHGRGDPSAMHQQLYATMVKGHGHRQTHKQSHPNRANAKSIHPKPHPRPPRPPLNNSQIKPRPRRRVESSHQAQHGFDDSLFNYYQGIPSTNRKPNLCYKRPKGVEYKCTGKIETSWFKHIVRFLNCSFVFVLNLIINVYHYRVNCIGGDAKVWITEEQRAEIYAKPLEETKQDVAELYKRGVMKCNILKEEEFTAERIGYFNWNKLYDDTAKANQELAGWINFLKDAGNIDGEQVWIINRWPDSNRYYLQINVNASKDALIKLQRAVTLMNSFHDFIESIKHIPDMKAWFVDSREMQHFHFS